MEMKKKKRLSSEEILVQVSILYACVPGYLMYLSYLMCLTR